MNADRHISAEINALVANQAYGSALALAEEQLAILRMAYGEDLFSIDAPGARKLIDDTRSKLSDLEKRFKELSLVCERMSGSEELKDARVIHALSSWLANIKKMKKDSLID